MVAYRLPLGGRSHSAGASSRGPRNRHRRAIDGGNARVETQPLVLAPQPRELRALVSRDAVVTHVAIDLVLAAPVAQRLRRHPDGRPAQRACAPDAAIRPPHDGTTRGTVADFYARVSRPPRRIASTGPSAPCRRSTRRSASGPTCASASPASRRTRGSRCSRARPPPPSGSRTWSWTRGGVLPDHQRRDHRLPAPVAMHPRRNEVTSGGEIQMHARRLRFLTRIEAPERHEPVHERQLRLRIDHQMYCPDAPLTRPRAAPAGAWSWRSRWRRRT